MIFKYLLVISILVLAAFGLKAQVRGLDTTEHKRYPLDIKYVTYLHNEDYVNIDTTLNNLFLHRPIENCFTCFDLGNIGLPSFDGQFNGPFSTDLQSGITAFDRNIFTLGSLAFYKVRRPYTDLYYTLGSKNEQIFHATLALRLTSKLFAGFNMQYAAANAFYGRQKTPFSNFSGYTQYTSKKQHFISRAGFVVNRVRAPINGGVASDTFINDPTITQKILEPIRLDTAVNKLKHTGVVWQTSYDFGHVDVDTTKKENRYTLHKQVRVENTFTYEKYKYLFSDDSSDVSYYYVPFPHYTIQDSITEHKFTEELGLKFYHKSSSISAVSGGLNYIRLFQPLSSNKYSQYFIKVSDNRRLFELKKDSAKVYNCSYSLHGQSAYSSIIKGSYLLEGTLNFFSIKQRIYRSGSYYTNQNDYGVSLTVKQSSALPTLLQDNYNTTLYQWQNSFQNISSFQSSILLYIRHINLYLANTTTAHYIYYGLDAMPHQYSGTVNVSQAKLEARFKIVWRIYTADEVLYQKINNTDVVNLPAVIVRTQLYYESDAFKKASHVQLGIMVRYWSDYYAPSYMPATMQFYLQQEKVVKYIPMGDVFASMQIKTAQLFLRFANVGSYLTKQINYSAVHYPMQDATMHFGIKWIMWN